MRNPDRFNAALGTVLSLALLLAGQPVLAQTMHTLPFVTPASNTSQRSLVRIINRSDRAGTVTIHGIDDSGERFGPVSFRLRAKQTKHLDSRQLERGATLSGGVGLGNGEGNWRLELETQLDIVPLAYIRGAQGFVTTMHDVVRGEAMRHHVLTFNKAPVSRGWSRGQLRLINPSDDSVDVTITGHDDYGNPGAGAVSVTLPAGASRTLTAHQLEGGDDDFDGSLGDEGIGRWQLFVSADRPIQVMSLMLSPNTGYMTNLSSMKGDDVIQGDAPADQAAFDTLVVGKRMILNDTPLYYWQFVSPGRFVNPDETEEDGEAEGSYTYENTGPDTGTLEMHYDGGQDSERCTAQFTFESATTGTSTYSCTGEPTATTSWRLVDIPSSDAPDLMVESPSVSDNSLEAGASFTLSATVRNQGSDRSAATTLRYYRSSDAAISSADTEVGTDDVSGLAASGTSDESIALSAPSSAGTYYYGACVDTVSGESNTANNCSNGVAVTVRVGVSGTDCYVGQLVRPGESCTYPGTDTEFSVDSSGFGRFLFIRAGQDITIINTNFNGRLYTFVATHQGGRVWRIERVGS